ncbi:MAG: MFS transporter [Verrucomicrobia bacterium]|nr:MFS transporter [Verrucomicrobiota bacterium]MBU1735493.1 MFS transporter [Verrucomicrobiota bacterium]MBU1856888.1 MFS transporter [Verrucomicrobiota bacterium]
MTAQIDLVNDRKERGQPAGEIITEVSRKGMRNAIIGACYKILSTSILTNGLMLIYMTALKLDGTTILLLLSLCNGVMAFSLIPCAHLADVYGKRRITLWGIALCGIGFVFIPLAAWVSAGMVVVLLGLGLALFGIGQAGQMGPWYALLAPIVPAFYRGRFFGAMRVSWQVCAVILAGLIALLLPRETSLPLLAGVLIVLGFSILPWGIYFARIPELERATCSTRNLPRDFGSILRSGGYLPFCAYLFIIALFTGGCLAMFGLVEKQVLGMDDSKVMILANLTMIGAVIGYYFGGKAVDRIGTKPVFLICHFGYGASLALFVMRDSLFLPPLYLLAVTHAVFGGLAAAGSIAFATEMLALIPAVRKSLSTSICTTMTMAGAALSGLLGAWGIRLGIFSESWTLAGGSRSAYDAVLMVYAVLIVLMTVTLGLIPSVVGRPDLRGGPTVV